MKNPVIGLILVAALAAVTGCSKKEPDQRQQAPPELRTQTAPAHSTGEPAVAGIRWVVPQGWAEQPPRQMRFTTYMTQPAHGDAEGAECAVFFFGSGQGGSVQDNIDRWVNQFENATDTRRSEKEVNGLKVSLVQVNGTYVGMTGPMMGSGEKKSNYTLLGAIVEAPQGMVFFKLTGPKATVASVEGAYNTLLGSLQKE